MTDDAPPPPHGPRPAPGDDQLRRRIAREAGRGMARGSDARRATFRAARRVAREWVPADRIPGPAEVREEAHRQLDPAGAIARLTGDRFDALAAMVAVLATVRQSPERHPEGDALEHSLQVFDLVHRERPYDEELLTAALVHDLGKAIDRRNAVAATLAAIDAVVSPRTRWLVESLPAALAYHDGTLGQRARRRLEGHPDFLDALLLAEADRRGRVRGYDTPSLDDAIAVLRALDRDDEPPRA